MEKDSLKQLSVEFRDALVEAISASPNVGPELIHFPSGSCDIASSMLGLYLEKCGCGKGDLVVGRKDGRNHVWLAVAGFIVDITADQFEECHEPVMVAVNSPFHDSFEVYEHRPVVFENIIRPSIGGYAVIYKEVFHRLAKNSDEQRSSGNVD